MITDSMERDSSRSLSAIVIDDHQVRHIRSLFSCCGCWRTWNHSDGRRGFFKRIQSFKARKRQSSVRKQQFTSNGPLAIEIDQLADDVDERSSNTTFPQGIRSSPYVLRNCQSIPYLNQTDPIRRVRNAIDAYSFSDIELESSINERKSFNPNATPKSIVSHNLSVATTNLSDCSNQQLLRKLLDKAQMLDEYYKDLAGKAHPRPAKPSSFSLSSSSNSLLGKSRSLLYRHQSTDSMRKSPRRKCRNLVDNLSSESSRYNLYIDEDNILRELVRFNNDIDLILSRLEMNGEINQVLPLVPPVHLDQEEIVTMQPETNEISVHSLRANDIDRLRETALSKFMQMAQDVPHAHNETITLTKLNKLPKSSSWKGKRVFGVPLRIYQQTTGQVLPIGIVNALQYVRMHAGKCDGLFRKPGVKSKIDRLRAEIERTDSSFDMIKFDEYQPFVVADVIRQYFRELPECLIPPSIARLLCDLLKYVPEEEQILAIRYSFLLLSDEAREVLETILRFLLDVSIRLGNSQSTCRSLARIFLPSVFQSYDNLQGTSSKIHWWKWKREKSNGIEQENDRLVLEQCLMTMIIHVDLLCRVPNVLSNELKLPSTSQTKRLDELVRNECNGDFHLKKFIFKKTEQFLQRLSTTKFKTVSTNLNGVHISIHKSSVNSNANPLPTWKCSMDIPNSSVKQVQQRILYEQYLWDNSYAESRTIERIDHDKDIIQYVLNSHDLTSIRSFCEFRFSKKVAHRSTPTANAVVISSTSIDHLQNHFLPGSIGITYEMFYYLTPSNANAAYTTVTQIACVDYSGRSSQWHENLYGSLLAHNLISLRETFTDAKV